MGTPVLNMIPGSFDPYLLPEPSNNGIQVYENPQEILFQAYPPVEGQNSLIGAAQEAVQVETFPSPADPNKGQSFRPDNRYGLILLALILWGLS